MKFLLTIIFSFACIHVVAQTDSMALLYEASSLSEKNNKAQQLYESGHDLYVGGQLKKSIEKLNYAIHLKPFFPDAYFTRAAVKEAKEDFVGALIDYETVERQDENNKEAKFKIALLHLQIGNYSACIEAITQLIEEPVGTTNAVFYKRKSKQAAGEAIGTTGIYTLQTQKADFYNLRGQCLMAKQNFAEAINDFDYAIEINAVSDYFVNKGLACEQMDKPLQAEQNFKQALRMNPWNQEAIFNLTLKNDKSSNEVMIDSYTNAIKQNSQLAEAYINRGVLWYEEQQFHKAFADFDSAYQLMPRDVDVLLNRGLALEKLGQHRKALKNFELAQQQGAEAALVYGYQANANYHLKNYIAAERLYTLSLSLADDENYYFNRGICRYRLGKKSAACQDFQVASQSGLEVANKTLQKYCTAIEQK